MATSRPTLAWLTLAAALGSTSPLRAHRLDVDVLVSGEDLVVEAYYPIDDAPASGASVEIRRASGELLVSGEADQEGRFRWHPTISANLRVAVDDGQGHRAEVDVPRERVPAPSAPASPEDSASEEAGDRGEPERPAAGPGVAPGDAPLDTPAASSRSGGPWGRVPRWARIAAGLLCIALITLGVRRRRRRRPDCDAPGD